MQKDILRFQQITLQHFKNVEKGIVAFPNYLSRVYYNHNSEIIGLYGQNGSGKTALVEAVMLVQRLLSGHSLPANTAEYIQKPFKEAAIGIIFFYQHESEDYLIDYDVILSHNNNGDLWIASEKVSYLQIRNGKKGRRSTIMEYQNDAGAFIKPARRYQEMLGDRRGYEVDLLIARRLSQIHLTSFIFHEETVEISKKCLKNPIFNAIFFTLKSFASDNLFVIRKDSFGSISTNMFLPLTFRVKEQGVIWSGEVPIELSEPSVLDLATFQLIEQLLEQMNHVLSAIVPGLTMEAIDHGSQLTDDGSSGVRMELASVRGGVRIPLRNESEGIKKLLSILSALVTIFNFEDTCLVIDELDSGVFEFMLGEILRVIEIGGRGQMIFTSHNLRALEMLSKDCLLFSTANPTQRYVRLAHVKKDMNLRDFYFRSIDLGGQKECIYEETNSFELRRAFRMARQRT